MKRYPLLIRSPLLLILITACADTSHSYNAMDFADWRPEPADGPTYWTVQDGAFYGANPDELKSTLWTRQTYTDFEMQLEYRAESEDYDSGIFIRAEQPQVQIGVSRSLQRDLTASIYAPEDEKGLYPAQTDKAPQFHKLGEWNDLRIRVEGNRIQTWLNNEPFVDYESGIIPQEGPIGLQLHPNVDMKMRFRNIRITPLN